MQPPNRAAEHELACSKEPLDFDPLPPGANAFMASDDSQQPDPSPQQSFAARLKRAYGEDLDPAVSLAGDGVPAPAGAMSGLLDRLAEQGVKSPRYRLEDVLQWLGERADARSQGDGQAT